MLGLVAGKQVIQVRGRAGRQQGLVTPRLCDRYNTTTSSKVVLPLTMDYGQPTWKGGT